MEGRAWFSLASLAYNTTIPSTPSPRGDSLPPTPAQLSLHKTRHDTVSLPPLPCACVPLPVQSTLSPRVSRPKRRSG